MVFNYLWRFAENTLNCMIKKRGDLRGGGDWGKLMEGLKGLEGLINVGWK